MHACCQTRKCLLTLAVIHRMCRCRCSRRRSCRRVVSLGRHHAHEEVALVRSHDGVAVVDHHQGELAVVCPYLDLEVPCESLQLAVHIRGCCSCGGGRLLAATAGAEVAWPSRRKWSGRTHPDNGRAGKRWLGCITRENEREKGAEMVDLLPQPIVWPPRAQLLLPVPLPSLLVQVLSRVCCCV